MTEKTMSYRSETAFSLLEVMAAILLLSITTLGITRSTILSYRTGLRNERNGIALQLALQKMEDMAGVNPVTLSDANDAVETPLVIENLRFNRVTNVTVNGDNSRTVSVVVNSNKPELGGHAELENTFALWGTM